jgi:hypothetical protein
MCVPEAWGFAPWDFLSISAYALGHKLEAKEAAAKALELCPGDQRLSNNLQAIAASLQ